MRLTRPAFGALALVIVASGCGSSASMSDSARRRLDSLVASVRSAAVSRDGARVDAALASLRNSVHGYEQSGDISRQRASEILAAAAQVESRLAPFATTTTTTTTLPQPQDEDQHDSGKHRGKHKGDNGDEG